MDGENSFPVQVMAWSVFNFQDNKNRMHDLEHYRVKANEDVSLFKSDRWWH